MKLTKLLFIISLFSALLITAGCKSQKETGFVGQVYHDITSRNNAYFNGNEKLKLIQKNIKESYKYNYEEIIPIRTNRNPELAEAYASDLDEVVKKASIAIKRHEPSKWTDNSYMLVGKSYFLKGEYKSALETFQFITTNFKDGTIEPEKGESSASSAKSKKKTLKQMKKRKKKKKKKKGKPKTAAQKEAEQLKKAKEESKKDAEDEAPPTSIFRHKKSRSKALIWLADTYTELERYKDAEAVFTIIESEEYFPQKLDKELYLSKADLFVKKGSIARAIEPLTNYIALLRKKKQKGRYLFILGQIYEHMNQYPDAIRFYQEVGKCRPNFELDFNAKMNIARLAGKDQSLPKGNVIELLSKLLKDDKNEDFFDQIYYAMAELELQDSNKSEAIDLLKKSVEVSTTNSEQKGLSFMKIGDIYYNDREYAQAYSFYDSTLAFLPQSHKAYETASWRESILGDLVSQLNTINEQDSLLYLGSLSDVQREKMISQILQKKRKEKQEQQLADLENDKLKQNQKVKPKEPQVTGSWYFYNPSAKSTGYNEFIRRWGNRPLEDNWRRSNKNQASVNTDSSDIDTNTDLLITDAGDELEKEELEKAIPISSGAVKASNDKLVEAYYKLGNIYRIDVKDNANAIKTFEELLERFPNNKYLVETYYNLYILHADNGNSQQAQYYKDRITQEFPKSDFAKIIYDPKFRDKKDPVEQQLEEYYSTTYRLYATNRIQEALQNINAVDSLFKENSMAPQFALLQAYAIGKTKDVPKYVQALQDVVTTFPTHEVKEKAEEILRYLKDSENDNYTLQVNITEYNYDPDALHFVLAVFEQNDFSSESLMNSIASYNDVNHSLDNLQMNSLGFNNNKTIVIIKSFANLKKAKQYSINLTQSLGSDDKTPMDEIDFCIISDVNFNIVISHREIDSYFHFFTSRYPK